MLPGVVIKPLKRHFDERGSFTELMRLDWKDILGEDVFVQANLSITYPGIVRAWHRHLRGQVDYFIVIRGAAKICAYDEDTRELAEIYSYGERPQIVRVPGHYWHGFKSIGIEQTYLIYFVTKLYNYDDPDEERRPWNDPDIVPKTINGRRDDPRCNKPWNWFHPPHR